MASSHRPTYPGIIPYRSSSPSYPDPDANVPELIKVNHNFSLRRAPSSSLVGKKFQSLSNLQKTSNNTLPVSSSADINTSASDLRNKIRREDEIRSAYFEYWAEQQVCQILLLIQDPKQNKLI